MNSEIKLTDPGNNWNVTDSYYTAPVTGTYSFRVQLNPYITTNGSVVVSGLTSLNTSGYGNVYVTNYAGNNTAYIIADNNFVHIGSATNNQLNLKVNGQTPAYIDTSGNFNITGNTTIGSGNGTLNVQNSTASVKGSFSK